MPLNFVGAPAELRHLNIRKEGPEDDKVLAVDLKLQVILDSLYLQDFDPLHTITTKDRFALVTVKGEIYAIADIGMRMLQPRELYRAQGFPDTYVIDRGADGRALSKVAQVRMCGNSVCPPIARALVEANYGMPAARRAA